MLCYVFNDSVPEIMFLNKWINDVMTRDFY